MNTPRSIACLAFALACAIAGFALAVRIVEVR